MGPLKFDNYIYTLFIVFSTIAFLKLLGLRTHYSPKLLRTSKSF